MAALAYPAAEPRVGATLILAHGAGADQRSPFMVTFAQALAQLGVYVVTFNFPYSQQRRRMPDRRPVLEGCYRAVVETVRGTIARAGDPLFIGGKSMGGRIATHVASADPDLPVAGLVLLGYPLHPPGRPNERRDSHLGDVGRPMLIVQGSRDSFGAPAEFESVVHALAVPATLHVVEGGDHSFKVPKSGKPAQAAVFDQVQRAIVAWMEDLTRGRPGNRPQRG